MKGVLVDCNLPTGLMCPEEHWVDITPKSRGKTAWCIHNGKICPYLLLKVTGEELDTETIICGGCGVHYQKGETESKEVERDSHDDDYYTHTEYKCPVCEIYNR